jgi:hypothetical protein
MKIEETEFLAKRTLAKYRVSFISIGSTLVSQNKLFLFKKNYRQPPCYHAALNF